MTLWADPDHLSLWVTWVYPTAKNCAEEESTPDEGLETVTKYAKSAPLNQLLSRRIQLTSMSGSTRLTHAICALEQSL